MRAVHLSARLTAKAYIFGRGLGRLGPRWVRHWRFAKVAAACAALIGAGYCLARWRLTPQKAGPVTVNARSS